MLSSFVCNTEGVVFGLNSSEEIAAGTSSASITFDAGGGSGSMDQVQVLKGSTYILPGCSFTAPEGQVFDKWSTDSAEKEAQKEIVVNSDLTVTALWKSKTAQTYSVSVTADKGGKAAAEKSSSADNETVKIVATPDAGYRFVRWDVEGAAIDNNTAAVATLTGKGQDAKAAAKFEEIHAEGIALDESMRYCGEKKRLFLTRSGTLLWMISKNSRRVYIQMKSLRPDAQSMSMPVLSQRNCSFTVRSSRNTIRDSLKWSWTSGCLTGHGMVAM